MIGTRMVISIVMRVAYCGINRTTWITKRDEESCVSFREFESNVLEFHCMNLL